MKIGDKILSCTADAALEAFLTTLGIPSCGGAYEPEVSEEMKAYKAAHMSKLEKLLNK
jgi:hypothetical protein